MCGAPLNTAVFEEDAFDSNALVLCALIDSVNQQLLDNELWCGDLPLHVEIAMDFHGALCKRVSGCRIYRKLDVAA